MFLGERFENADRMNRIERAVKFYRTLIHADWRRFLAWIIHEIAKEMDSSLVRTKTSKNIEFATQFYHEVHSLPRDVGEEHEGSQKSSIRVLP